MEACLGWWKVGMSLVDAGEGISGFRVWIIKGAESCFRPRRLRSVDSMFVETKEMNTL